MRQIKRFILVIIVLGALFFLFGPEVFPENYQFHEILNSTNQNDVIIIFNSGGWGNTPLEEAEDFAPIIEGIQETLNNLGLNSIVITYNRTKDNLLGKITGTKDFLNSFEFSSKILAKEVEILIEKLPDKKIILAGLSAGGAFVSKTYEKISEKTKVYTIATGIPFCQENFESENILQLNNNGRDSLAEGDAKALALALFKAPFKWISAKVNGENLSFPQAIRVPGHQYFWSEVKSDVISFLEDKFEN